MRIVVYHGYYGCETGCCGHYVSFCSGDCDPGDCDCTVSRKFDFDHANSAEEAIEFAKKLIAKKFGEEHVKDLDWDNCRVFSYDNC